MQGCSVTTAGSIACLATINTAVEHNFNLANNVFPDFGKLLLCNTAPTGTVRLFNNVLNTTEIKNAHNLTFIGVPSKTSELTNDAGYLKSIPSEYVTESELSTKGYLTAVPAEYVTETELDAKGYLTQHQDLSGYAKTSQLPTKTSQLSNDSGFLTAVPAEYVTETELSAKGYLTAVPAEYVTETELTSKGYLTLSTLPKYDGGVS